MIEKKIEVCIGTDRGQNVRARLSLLVVDGDTVLSEQYHSINLTPGADPTQNRASVEAHLAIPQDQGGIPGGPWPAIPDAEWAKVTGTVAVFHTPEVVEKQRVAIERLQK